MKVIRYRLVFRDGSYTPWHPEKEKEELEDSAKFFRADIEVCEIDTSSGRISNIRLYKRGH